MKNSYLPLVFILILSGFVHLWNPVGFPDIFFDEGVYMRRAMNVMQHMDPQESYLYDHPYFGQILLGGAMKLISFPESLNITTDTESLKELYMAPRIFMGLLAIVDTFLIYKIAEKKYDNKIAILAALLFAVMPFSWILKRILLDSLLLPFLLGSILVALHVKTSPRTWILLSGILFGIAVFTKIPSMMFSLLVGMLIFQYRKKIRDLTLWLIPVILIPTIWVLIAATKNQVDLFVNDVLWQTNRQNNLLETLEYFFDVDPVFMILGVIGLGFAAYKKDYFLLCWFSPFMIFLIIVGYTQYFYLILLAPVLSIAGAQIIFYATQKLYKNHSQIIITCAIIIATFGLASLLPLITLDVSSSQFEAMAFVLQNTKDDSVTILSSPVYSWVFSDVFSKDNIPLDYGVVLFDDKNLQNVLLIADYHFMLDIPRGAPLEQIHNETKTIATFDSNLSKFNTEMYPFDSLKLNFEGSDIHIRTNYGQ